MKKKLDQLGMHPSTAAHRLKIDLLFAFVLEAGNVCFRCQKPMTRADFSIEHKRAWLDSDRPRELFFDLSNIGYSHTTCNIGAARKTNKQFWTPEARRIRDTELERQRWARLGPEQQRARRRQNYERNGC